MVGIPTCEYWYYNPILGNIPKMDNTGKYNFSELKALLYYNVINQVNSYWSSSEAEGRPWTTADRGPPTGPIWNYLINDNFIN